MEFQNHKNGMTEVPEERLRRVLTLYKPELRFLVKASTKFPSAEGRFDIKGTFYTEKPLEHVTSIETQLCLNQLAYSAFGEWIPEGRFKDKGLELSFDDYCKLVEENMFITDTKMRFRDSILKDKAFILGELGLMKFKRYGRLYVALLACNMENRKFNGELEVILKLPRNYVFSHSDQQ